MQLKVPLCAKIGRATALAIRANLEAEAAPRFHNRRWLLDHIVLEYSEPNWVRIG